MEYINLMGYYIELGKNCIMEKQMSMHCWNRIGRKMAINSFQTNLRRKQMKILGVRLPTSSLLEMTDTGDIETVDIKEFLPQRVISYMSRNDGTMFKIMRCGLGRVVDNQVRLRRKINDLVNWKNERKMDRSVVECMVNETLNAYYDNEITVN